MELKERIKLEAKSTIGYSEAENKESFMVGVGVAISLMEIHYKEKIKNLERNVNSYKSTALEAVSEIKTIASIINRYSDND